MAVVPLFVENIDTLRSAVKMSGSTQVDTETAINRAIQNTRVAIYQALGSTKVATILSYTYNENPSTDNELTRVTANNLEVNMVKLLLVRELPMLFMDSSSNVDQVWNEEGLLRNSSQTQTRELIEFLQSEIDEALSVLSSGEEIGNVQAFNVGPTTTPDRPGASVRSATGGMFGGGYLCG